MTQYKVTPPRTRCPLWTSTSQELPAEIVTSLSCSVLGGLCVFIGLLFIAECGIHEPMVKAKFLQIFHHLSLAKTLCEHVSNILFAKNTHNCKVFEIGPILQPKVSGLDVPLAAQTLSFSKAAPTA